MSDVTNRKELLTVWRRRLFYVWVVAALVALLVAGIGGPMVSTDGADGTTMIALVSPIAMLVFIVSGIAWLVLLTFSHRSKYTHEPPPG